MARDTGENPVSFRDGHHRRDDPRQEDAMAIKVGDRLPEGTLTELGASGPAPVNVTEATKGKKIVIFGIPGAFTPT
jgi:hypothetical protein